ncbi:hypothetical protein H4F52_05120 [Pectobacterium brasiliense]|uniref:hypothetical protein n=1 Tax=Pectobacterium brasiliense TaxID=180957 RepID=UPI0019694C81|nr:hypothetical protein [Pectobacterium brasiliense]MBN3131135.1 hypothetical protein [Pectobacterium brasiliense]
MLVACGERRYRLLVMFITYSMIAFLTKLSRAALVGRRLVTDPPSATAQARQSDATTKTHRTPSPAACTGQNSH